MHGKRVRFDDDTWDAIKAVAKETGSTFPELAAQAFADLLKKHHQPIGFFAALDKAWEGTGAHPRRRETALPMAFAFGNSDQGEAHESAPNCRATAPTGSACMTEAHGSFRSPVHGQSLCLKLDIMCQRIVLGGHSGVQRNVDVGGHKPQSD